MADCPHCPVTHHVRVLHLLAQQALQQAAVLMLLLRVLQHLDGHHLAVPHACQQQQQHGIRGSANPKSNS